LQRRQHFNSSEPELAGVGASSVLEALSTAVAAVYRRGVRPRSARILLGDEFKLVQRPWRTTVFIPAPAGDGSASHIRGSLRANDWPMLTIMIVAAFYCSLSESWVKLVKKGTPSEQAGVLRVITVGSFAIYYLFGEEGLDRLIRETNALEELIRSYSRKQLEDIHGSFLGGEVQHMPFSSAINTLLIIASHRDSVDEFLRCVFQGEPVDASRVAEEADPSAVGLLARIAEDAARALRA
jgi:hypothetical protein